MARVRHPILRWVKRVVLGVLALLVLGVGGALAALHTDWGREIVRKQVVKQLNNTFTGGASIGKIEGSPFGELVAREVVINGPDGKPAIGIGTLHLEISLRPLLSHDVYLDRVAADDVDVQLARNADGTLQIGQLMKPGPSGGWNVYLPDVEIHRGHLFVDTGAADPAQRRVDLDALQIDAAAKLPHEGTTNATAILHAVYRQRAVPVDLALTFRADDEVINAPALVGSIGGGMGLALADLRLAKGDKLVLSGMVSALAPRALVAQLAPGVELPDDIAVSAFVSPDGDQAHASLFGMLGVTPVRAFVHGDIAAKSGQGLVVTGNLDAGLLSKGAVAGTGGVVVAFDAAAPAKPGDLPVATAMITGWGALSGQPRIQLAVALTTDADHVQTQLGATTPGALVALAARITKHGAGFTLDDGRLLARAQDPARITPISPAVYGSLHGDLTAHGELSPSPNLAVLGRVDGEHLKLGDLTIASLQFHADAQGLPATPSGTVRLVLAGVDKGPQVALETLTIAAASRPDKSIQVSVRTRPRAHPYIVDADAIVTPGPTTVVQLTHHHVRAEGVDWVGSTGRLEIGPSRIALTNLATTSPKGTLALDVDYRHTTSSGHVTLKATGEVARAGTANVELDLDTPASLGDLAAWARMPRSAIHRGQIIVKSDLAQAAALVGPLGLAGLVDVKIQMTPTDITGSIDVAKLTAPALATTGPVTAHVELGQKGTADFSTQAVARIDGLATARLDAAFDMPDHVFDLAAWKALDRRAFKGAHLKLDEISLDTAFLDQLHMQNEMRGKIDFALDVPAGGATATLVLDVHQLRGGPIARPLDVHLETTIDDKETTAAFHAATKQGELLTLALAAPMTLSQLVFDPGAALATKLKATLTLPTIQASELLATFGRNDITKGTVGGTVELAGTIGKPTLIAKLAGTDLTVPPSVGSTRTQVMRSLTLDASWDGTTGKLAVVGDESTGGTLRFTAQGSPAAPDDVIAAIQASSFDVRAVTVFSPGMVGEIAGRLDGKMDVRGANPRTMDISGKLVFTASRIPIAPAVGTLRQANIELSIVNRVVKINATGKLGHDGTVKLVAEAPLEAGAPTGGTATMTIRKVSPIGAVQPVIDSDITATLSRADETWKADVHVAHTLVTIPDKSGQALDPVGPPTDMVYDIKKRPAQAKKADPTQKAPPPHPLFVANVDLGDVIVESKEARGLVHGKLVVSLGEAPVGGSPLGIVGDVDVSRGNVELFDRRYEIERAAVHFDGSIDPQLDVRVTYDFPDVTTVTEVRGRLSKPELNLSSEPGIYSQSELLGFLLGGEPNGDTQQAQSAGARVSAAGTSLIANQIGGYVKKALPISIDVIKYEAASSVNSAAVTVGSWITHTLFVAYRQHLETRPDENAGEGDVEYYIKPRVILQGTAGDRGYDGVDLLWRKRW